MVQHDFLHMSFFQDDFRAFVDTLVVALRHMDQRESPMAHIHPVAIRESDLSDEGRADFGLGSPVREDDNPGDSDLIELTTPPTLTEVGDRG